MTVSDREQHDDFLRLFMEREESLRVFVRSLLFSHEEEREVMQDVAVVLWRKFDPSMDSGAFCRWAFGVARMEAMAFRRDRARDRHTFGDEVFEFLDPRTVPSAPVAFACHIYLFEGSVESLHTAWPPTARDTLGVGASYILSSGGPDANAWRKVTARCVLTPQADLAVVKLSAGRGDRYGGPVPELGEQFADDVKLTLKTQPELPVRLVQP